MQIFFTRFRLSLFIMAVAVFIIISSAAPRIVNAATIGDLVKCSDFSSVYYLAEDGNRYVFPNEKIYFSWYDDFNDVKNISCDDLADLSIGGNMVYRSGSRLFKLLSAPTVYAVETGGAIRAITSEEQAEKLYGSDWADRIDDLSDAFWSGYSVLDQLTDSELPNGFVLKADDSDDLYQVFDGTAIKLTGLFSDEDLNVLDKYSIKFFDIEERLDTEIDIINQDDGASAEVIAAISALQERVDVDDEDVVDDSEFDFEEEDTATNSDTGSDTDNTTNETGEDTDTESDSYGYTSAECRTFLEENAGVPLSENFECEMSKYSFAATSISNTDADYTDGDTQTIINENEQIDYIADLYYIRDYSSLLSTFGLTNFSHWWIFKDLTISGTYSYYYESTSPLSYDIITGPDGNASLVEGEFIGGFGSTDDDEIPTFNLNIYSDTDNELGFVGTYTTETEESESTATEQYSFDYDMSFDIPWDQGNVMTGESTTSSDVLDELNSGYNIISESFEWSIIPN